MGIDWNFFMTLSPNNSVKTHHRELLLETYYSALVVALTNRNYDNTKIPTLKNVQDEVSNYEFYGQMIIYPLECNYSNNFDF